MPDDRSSVVDQHERDDERILAALFSLRRIADRDVVATMLEEFLNYCEQDPEGAFDRFWRDDDDSDDDDDLDDDDGPDDSNTPF